jgi:hypothetical protein
MIAVEGGGHRMVTHEEYVEWIKRCAREWNGKRQGGLHAALLRDKADRIRDPKSCPVCQWHAARVPCPSCGGGELRSKCEVCHATGEVSRGA